MNRQYGLFIAGYALSVLGDYAWLVALGWAAARQESSLGASVLLIAGTLPRAILMIIGGAITDRLGVRRTVLITQSARVLCMLGAASILSIAGLELSILIAIALIFGSLDAVNMPATGSIPPFLVEADQLPKAQAWLQTVQRIAGVLGAPAGGFLISLGGLSLGTLTFAGLFFLALLAFSGLQIPTLKHSPTTERKGILRDTAEGIRHAVSDTAIRNILVAVAALNFCLMGVLNSGVALTVRANEWSATQYGVLQALFAGGAALGAVVLIIARKVRYPTRAGLICILPQMFLIALPAVNSSFLSFALCAAGLGITSGPAGPLLLGAVQARTPPSHMGRMGSLIGLTAVGLTPVSIAFFGLIAEFSGLDSAFIAYAATSGMVVTLALLSRVTRQAKAAPDKRLADRS